MGLAHRLRGPPLLQITCMEQHSAQKWLMRVLVGVQPLDGVILWTKPAWGGLHGAIRAIPTPPRTCATRKATLPTQPGKGGPLTMKKGLTSGKTGKTALEGEIHKPICTVSLRLGMLRL